LLDRFFLTAKFRAGLQAVQGEVVGHPDEQRPPGDRGQVQEEQRRQGANFINQFTAVIYGQM
jgi:hypothetical protein